MSIHKSKGLEFPIVFVAGMGKNFNKQDTRGKLLIDADLGIGTDYLDSEKRIKGPTLKKNVMKRRKRLWIWRCWERSCASSMWHLPERRKN